jgi:hypothetical protein
MKFRLIAVTSVGLGLPLALASTTISAANNKQVEAEKIRRSAYELTNIRSLGSLPFHLLAHVEVFDEKNQQKEGSYSLFWKSPGSWREDIILPDFFQIRIAEENKIWLNRNVPYLTQEAFQLMLLMEFPDILRLKKDTRAENWRSDKRRLEISLEGLAGYTVQLDSTSTSPTQVEVYGVDAAYQFQDYAPFGTHNFPRTIIKTIGKRDFLKVHVLELTEAPSIETAQVTHSPNALWFHWCSDADPPKYQRTPMPRPARPNLSLLRKKDVAIYGVIGPDGRWHNLKVLKSGGPEVDTYWLNVLARQLYFPANCGGKPVETEIVRELGMP